MNVPPKLTSVDLMQTLAAWAQDLARTLLADELPRRWSHVQGVAARARTLAAALGPDADLLEAAAWLHDIGYHPDLAGTGLHGLDGARYLRDHHHADPMLCRLVAHHSCAVIEADERGLAHVLARDFAPPPQALADALTFCDMTTSPDGEHVQVEPPPSRDPRPLRPGSPGQPLDAPRHPAHPARPSARSAPGPPAPHRQMAAACRYWSHAGATAELRMLRPGPRPGVPRRAHLHLRMHLVPRLRGEHPARHLPELRRRARAGAPSARPTCSRPTRHRPQGSSGQDAPACQPRYGAARPSR